MWIRHVPLNGDSLEITSWVQFLENILLFIFLIIRIYRRYQTSLWLSPLRTLRPYPPIWPPSSTSACRSSAVSFSSTTCWTPSSSGCLCGAWPISDPGSTLSPWSSLPGSEHSPSPRPTSWTRYPYPTPLNQVSPHPPTFESKNYWNLTSIAYDKKLTTNISLQKNIVSNGPIHHIIFYV